MTHLCLGNQQSTPTYTNPRAVLTNLSGASQTENLEKCNITFVASYKNVELKCSNEGTFRQI
jgi:hypothetical protein